MKHNGKYLYITIIIALLVVIVLCYKDPLLLFLNKIQNSFQRSVIDENRYVLIIKGLKTTLLISFFSIILGTLLGVVLFLLQKTKIWILKIMSSTIVRFLQGVPVTVLLLVFYFGVFGSINIKPELVAIIAFSIYFSAYVSEIVKSSYNSINRTQIDSAYALGFTKYQTIKYVVLPQVLSYVIPVYKNDSVLLIKSTSIAGYISIMELTKASDIIRNRTYEAFFPLILTALIYFVICFLFCKLFDYIYKIISPKLVK